jgi:hypothetical protein
MRYRVFAAIAVAAALAAFVVTTSTPVGAQAAQGAQGKVPRTAWGKPSLEGTWDFRTITPLERPANVDKEFLTPQEAAKLEKAVVDRNAELDERPPQEVPKGGNVDRQADGSPGFYNNFWLDGGTKIVGTLRTSLITDPKDGKLPPMTDAAKKRAEDRRAYAREHPADSWTDLAAANRCLVGFNAGPPLSPGGYNQNLQIVQSKDTIVLLNEMVHTARIVPLDNRPHLSFPQWTGSSLGHWEGNTLVVETKGFYQNTSFQNSGPTMQIVERFTRVGPKELQYRYTVTDPNTWTKPFTVELPMVYSDLPIYEYACHEGNYGMFGLLSGARAVEKDLDKAKRGSN